MGDYVQWEDYWNGGPVDGAKSKLRKLGYSEKQISEIEDAVESSMQDTGSDD